MADLQSSLKNILNDLNENIKNKDDLEYIKTQIYKLTTVFQDELDRIAENNMNKIDSLVARYNQVDERISKMEKSIKNIEKDIYIEDEYDFQITCPYCDYVFEADFTDGVKKEVKCPECCNTIELDWNDEGSCRGGCAGCSSNCYEDNSIEYEPEELDEYDDDDM